MDWIFFHFRQSFRTNDSVFAKTTKLPKQTHFVENRSSAESPAGRSGLGKRYDEIITIETGLARCVAEPRGSHGLEGYGLGQSYRFERCQDGKGRYCRVYPDEGFPDYYETYGEGVFAGYFLDERSS